MHNHMVMSLDLIFAALSDPTRRGMLESLAAGETSISALAEPYSMSQPAISKHVRVLEKAGLVRRTKRGREHHLRVDPQTIETAQSWIAIYAQHWKRQFDAVDAYLKAQKPAKGRGTSK